MAGDPSSQMTLIGPSGAALCRLSVPTWAWCCTSAKQLGRLVLLGRCRIKDLSVPLDVPAPDGQVCLRLWARSLSLAAGRISPAAIGCKLEQLLCLHCRHPFWWRFSKVNVPRKSQGIWDPCNPANFPELPLGGDALDTLLPCRRHQSAR